jgi:Na+-transporting NADH:ubiquinone oxidoreductase subunit A
MQMLSFRNSKGSRLNLAGAPSPEMQRLKKPSHVACLPEKIPFVKPRLKVERGHRVRIGTVLFEDKRNPGIKFLSPGGGVVSDIRFGPRRVIEAIVIALDPEESRESFPAVEPGALQEIPRDDLVKRIMAGGLWPLIRELPFRDIARPHVTPPAVYVNLTSQEPFQPAPEVYLKDRARLFESGIDILNKLADGRVMVYAAGAPDLAPLNGRVIHTVSGHYPVDDPGVFLYRTRQSAADNRAWYISGQDVLLLAGLITTGQYPVERVVAVGGSESPVHCHLGTRMGVPLAHLIGQAMPDGVRPVVGGVFRGYGGKPDGYLGFYETSLTLLPEGPDEEFLGFVRPGYRRASGSRAFLSALNAGPLAADCNCHGELRACVACNACNRVCPVDILPQLAFKSVLIEEVEEALAHGLLDCVECGLCTYVCPSKIDLCDILQSARRDYHKEQVAP